MLNHTSAPTGPAASSSHPPPDPSLTQLDPAEKRRRIGKDPSSHGPIQEVGLVQVDSVFFGPYEIKPWYPSAYVPNDPDLPQAGLDSTSSASNSQYPFTPQNKPRSTFASGLKRHSNGKFQRKKKVRLPKPPNPLPVPPLVSANIGSAKNGASERRMEKDSHEDEDSADSLSSLSSSSAGSPHSTTRAPHRLSPDRVYPSPQSHPPSQTSDGQNPPSKPTPSSNDTSVSNAPAPLQLFVCDGCMRYMFSAEMYLQHKKLCRAKHPPGRKVYQRGAHIIWEVDGSEAKLYCQCLSLFGKLFIDHKYIFFDVEGFNFYVLTEATSAAFDHVLGFFSKEKVSYDGYNLACIVTLPPYQKKGYGTLLIEFSYELDRHEAEKEERQTLGTPERPLSDLGAKGYLSFWTAVLVRYFRALFARQLTPGRARSASLSSTEEDSLEGSVTIRMTLEEVSRSTRLRPDDAALALTKSGLTRLRQPSNVDSKETIVISPELVEQVAAKLNVKRAAMDPQFVLLDDDNVDSATMSN